LVKSRKSRTFRIHRIISGKNPLKGSANPRLFLNNRREDGSDKEDRRRDKVHDT
jgi:hypothetical protein